MTEPRKKILCIEDDRETAALIAEELRERLSRLGFSVIAAVDSAEAEELQVRAAERQIAEVAAEPWFEVAAAGPSLPRCRAASA